MNSEVINKYKTPLYIFDIDVLKKRIDYIKSFFNNIEICYAIKANTFVIKEIINDVDRLEVCSNGEYEICKHLNIDLTKVVLSGVYKNNDDIENIFKNNEVLKRFTIESVNQFILLKRLTEKYQRKINILPRLTSNNQFGISQKDLEYVIENKNEYMNISGIEYFSTTQKHSIKRVTKEFDYVKEVINNIESKYNIVFNELEYGTGFPVYYFQDDRFNEKEYFTEFNKLIKDYFSDKKLILEIGRSLVYSCGEYYTKVVDYKENNTGKYIILDGGINHLVYYGQTMAMRVPFYEIINNNNKKEEVVNLCGALCTINDILVKQLEVPHLEIGDIFCFKNVGAYSVTEGISLFLSRDLPKVVLINNNKEEIVRSKVSTFEINMPNYKGE